MLCVGTKIGKFLPVTERHRAPFEPLSGGKSPHFSARRVHSPQMAAVDVPTVRVEQDRFPVRRKGPLIHFAVSWCEALPRSTFRRATTRDCHQSPQTGP